jgi:hypothetical protein
MEPRREESQKALEPSAAQKPKRFRIVKLEERIAPRRGGNGTNNGCGGGGTHGGATACGVTCPTYLQTLCGCPTQYPCYDPW